MWLLILRMRCGDWQMNTNGGTSKSDWFILRSFTLVCSVLLSVYHFMCRFVCVTFVGRSICIIFVSPFVFLLYLSVCVIFVGLSVSVLYFLVCLYCICLSVCLSVCYICWSVCIVLVGLSVCREHLECTGCHCMYEQEMYSAVVVKPGIAVADAGLDDLEIDVLVFNGCCKCVNDGS